MLNTLDQTEWLLLRANKLAALEILLLSMTHDINNALSVLLLETESHPEKGVQQRLATIAAIIKALQSYARKDSEQFVPCNLNDVIDKTLAICRTLLKNHPIDCQLDRTLPTIQANPSQLRQIIIDLILQSIKRSTEENTPFKLTLSTKLAKNNILVTYEDTHPAASQHEPQINNHILENHHARFRREALATGGVRLIIQFQK